LQAVVSDSGPLIHIAQINRLTILQILFGRVEVTSNVRVEVVDEGSRRKRPDAKDLNEAFKDGWLKTQTLSEQTLREAARLADGEGISPFDAEVILLAEQEKALFLSDDTALARLAEMYGLTTWDTWNLLLEALSRNLITITELEEAVDALGKKKFRLNQKQTLEILQAAKRVQSRKKGT